MNDEELLSSYVNLVNCLTRENLIYLNSNTKAALATSREVLRRVREQRRREHAKEEGTSGNS